MSTLRFRYQTIEFGDTDIHLRTLRNRQEYSDPDHTADQVGITSSNWSLFGVVWASGELLARLIYEYDIDGKRILEVGCGIGLASLVLNSRDADITATDHHPDVEGFLEENTRLNDGKMIPFVRTGWAGEESELGKFDIIIGSDLLYEKKNAELLAHFVNQHAMDHCVIIIVDPGRKHHAQFSRNMIELGYTHERDVPDTSHDVTQPIRGSGKFHVHTYSK